MIPNSGRAPHLLRRNSDRQDRHFWVAWYLTLAVWVALMGGVVYIVAKLLPVIVALLERIAR